MIQLDQAGWTCRSLGSRRRRGTVDCLLVAAFDRVALVHSRLCPHHPCAPGRTHSRRDHRSLPTRIHRRTVELFVVGGCRIRIHRRANRWLECTARGKGTPSSRGNHMQSH